MDITAGLSGLKTATDLIRILRDGLKSGQINVDEITGRLGEVYDHILDSKEALIDASDRMRTLEEQIAELKKQGEMKYIGGAYWTKQDDGAFCQFCWEAEKKKIRLSMLLRPDGTQPKGEEMAWFTCFFHKESRVALPANTVT